MPVEYVRPTWDDFEGWFDRHYEWTEVYPPGTYERVVALPLPSETKEIRVFTTIDTSDDDGRDCGSDAIRTVVWDTEQDVPVGGREYTKRIRTDDDPRRFLRNMHSKIEWLYSNWRAFDREMECPDCGGTLRGTDGEHGEFVFCTEECGYTDGLPDKICDECQGPMILLDGPHGEFFGCQNCENTEDA